MIYKNNTTVTGIYLNGQLIANGYQGLILFFGLGEDSTIEVNVTGDGLITNQLVVGKTYSVTYELVENTPNRVFGGGYYVFAGDDTDIDAVYGDTLAGQYNYYVSEEILAGNNPINYSGTFTFTAATTSLYGFWCLEQSSELEWDSGTVTIEEVQEEPIPNYLCFTSLEDGNVISFTKGSNVTLTIDLEYSNDGLTWTEWDYANNGISLDSNEKVYLRGVCPNGFCHSHTSPTASVPTLTNISNFGFTGYTNASGSIMSLINRNPNEMTIPSANYFFENLFYNCTTLMTAPELPAINLYTYCYSYMFRNCTSLITAPALPATTLTNYCYQGMFRGCSSLINPPVLNATTMTKNCYGHMFRECTSLVNAPALPATTLTEQCYSNMFYGCSSMSTAPVLPAENLALQCYTSIFRNCSSLNNITILALTNINFTNLAYWAHTTVLGQFDWAQTGTITLNENFDPDTLAEIRQTVNLIPDGWTYNKSTDPVVTYNSSTKTLSATPSTSLLYVDGTQVSNPYTFNPIYNTNYTYYATNKENGNVMTKTSSSTVTVEGYKTETPVISLNENTGVITGTGNGYVQLFIVDNVWYELSNPYQIPDSEIGIQHAYAACATENGKQQSDYVYQNIQWDGVPSETTVQITIAEMVSEFGWTNSTDNVKDTDWTIKGVTFRFEKGTGSTTPKYYSTGGGAIRFYAHNIMTITAGGSSIIQVKFTNNGNYKFVTGDCSDASYSEDGSYQIFDFNPGVTSVVINNSTSAQRRPNYFEVTFS